MRTAETMLASVRPTKLLGLLAAALALAPTNVRAQAPAPIAPEPSNTPAASVAPPNGNAAPAPMTPVTAIRHVPLTSAPAEESLVISATITAPDRMQAALVRYRRAGEASYRELPLSRASSDAWSATIPVADMSPGIIEYYIASRPSGAGPERLHFAAPGAPQRIVVVGDREARWREELLARHLGNHSRFQVQSEYVDFGERKVAKTVNDDPAPRRDYYWRIEGDYTYRILGWVYSIRLGAGVIRGSTFETIPNPAGGGTLRVEPYDPSTRLPRRVGLDYGFAELRFRFGRLVRADLRTTLGGGPSGFDGGAGAQLLIGHDPGTNFAIGFDSVSSIGTRAWLRLAWNTVPKVPMSMTLELTTLPDANEISGRVYLGAGYRFNRYFSMNASLGYATRDFAIGGPSVGLGANLEF